MKYDASTIFPFWPRALLLGLAAGLCACQPAGPPEQPAAEAAASSMLEETPPLQHYGSLGGDFTLTDHLDRPFRLGQAPEPATLLFFGFTFCPDVCPTTLARLAQVDNLLGPTADSLRTIFISVDPQRDTPQILKEYLGYFALEAVGLTGDKEDIDRVVSAYGATYSLDQPDTAGAYQVSHSTFTYLIDRRNTVRFLFRQADPPSKIAAVVQQLLDEADANSQGATGDPRANPAWLVQRLLPNPGCGVLWAASDQPHEQIWFVASDEPANPSPIQPAFPLDLPSTSTAP